MKKYYFLVLIFIFLFPFFVLAAEIKFDSEKIYLESEKEFSNLYIAAPEVAVYSKIKGDLTVAGGDILIVGDVENDLNIAGGKVVVEGNVGQDIRVAGGDIIIQGKVGGDIMAAGGRITIKENALVLGDVFIAGGNVVLENKIKGKTQVKADYLLFNSQASSKVMITAREFVLGDLADMRDGLDYKTEKPIEEIKDLAKVFGKTTFTSTLQDQNQQRSNNFLNFLFMISAAIFPILLLLRFKLSISQKIIDSSFNQFWQNLGLGFLVLILAPILAILLFIILIGKWIGFVLIFSYLTFIFIGIIFSGFIFGSWAWHGIQFLIKRKKEIQADWSVAFSGILALNLIYFIPVIGGVICFFFFLLAFGTVLRVIWTSHPKNELIIP